MTKTTPLSDHSGVMSALRSLHPYPRLLNLISFLEERYPEVQGADLVDKAVEIWNDPTATKEGS